MGAHCCEANNDKGLLRAKKSYREITREVVKQSIPNIASQMGVVATSFITVLFIASFKNKDWLASIGVATMIQNVFGVSLGIGLNSGLDTLVSQANGEKNYRQSGVYLHRAIVVSTIVVIPASLFLFFTGQILTAIGQDPHVSAYAGEYVHGTLIGMAPIYYLNALSTYLRAQKLPNSVSTVTWVGVAMHVAFCWMFIFTFDMGMFGAGLALSMTNLVSVLMLVAYIHLQRPGVTKDSWIAPDFVTATSNLGSFLEVSLPCAMLIWSEWWCFELMTILTGYLGVEALAANTAMQQVFIVLYMIPNGISNSAAALVGNSIGEMDPSSAKRAAVVASIGNVIISVIVPIFLFIFRFELCDVFSHDERVREMIVLLIHIATVFILLDSAQTVVDGILRGLGKQALAFKIKIVCMWLIRMPSATLLAFTLGWGIGGIWWGNCIGMLATCILYGRVLAKIDWAQEAEHSKEQREIREQAENKDSEYKLAQGI